MHNTTMSSNCQYIVYIIVNALGVPVQSRRSGLECRVIKVSLSKKSMQILCNILTLFYFYVMI